MQTYDCQHLLSTPDAVPKKRGPKTDVLEALLKRIDGLEKQLQPEDELPSSSGQREGSSKRAEIDIGSRHASRASSTPSRSDDIGERNKAASSSLGGGMTDTQRWVRAGHDLSAEY